MMNATKIVLTMLCLSSFALSNDASTGPELDTNLDFEETTSTPDLPEAVLPDMFKPPQVKASEDTAEEVNLVQVTELFFKLTFDEASNSYSRAETNEAKPGDLIELVIKAENKSDQVVTDVQMVNQIPQGPVSLVADSFKYDANKSLYRISRSGETFFPSDAELELSTIRFIQWHILSLTPGEVAELSYRLQINQ